MTSQIVALSGPRACGKSTIAQYLVDNHGYTRVAFSDALREISEITNPKIINDRMHLFRLGRKLRSLLPDFLIQVVKNRLQSIEGPVVIEDIRFPSEVEFCRLIGAIIVRFEIPIEIQRNRLSNRDGVVGEEAEQMIVCMDENALDEVDDWDFVIPSVGEFRELALAIHTGNFSKVNPVCWEKQ